MSVTPPAGPEGPTALPGQFTNALKGWSHLTTALSKTLPRDYWHAGNVRRQLRVLRKRAG